MKINDKFLIIPPYLSTRWEHVLFLSSLKEGQLTISLQGGAVLTLESLKDEIIKSAFTNHALFLERTTDVNTQKTLINLVSNPSDQQMTSIKFALGPIEGFGNILQHNPAQANAPDLPEEILKKLEAVSKIILPQDVGLIPKGDPSCNCFHCQIARVIHGSSQKKSIEVEVEEVVSDEDLTFQQWEIVPAGDKLFTVINKIDEQEKYSVYLGHPVGCTCGKTGCEHILAVLKS